MHIEAIEYHDGVGGRQGFDLAAPGDKTITDEPTQKDNRPAAASLGESNPEPVDADRVQPPTMPWSDAGR